MASKRTPILLTALLAVVPFFLAAQGDGTVANHLSQGDGFYHSFDNVAALSEYQRAYELNPTDREVLIRMVRIHNDMGRLMLRKNDSAEVWYSKAVEYAEQLQKNYPNNAQSYFWLALAKGSLVPFVGVKGKLDIGKEVAAYARTSIRMEPAFAPPYIILAIVYREADRLKWYEKLIANTIFGGSLPGTIEESKDMLMNSLALDSTSIYAYYELSRTYGQMGNGEGRIEALQHCLALIPRSLREQDQQDLARRQLQRALSAKRDSTSR